MKSIFTFSHLFILFPFVQTGSSNGLGGLEDTVTNMSDTIRTIFPIVLGVIFLVGVLMNISKFYGEHQDIKKGLTNILLFLLIVGAVGGIFRYIISINL